MTKPKINLPSDACPGTRATSTIVGDRIVFVHIGIDDGPANPLEDSEGMGRILSRGHRHINYKPDEIEAEKDNPDAVQLAYYEHGQCLWYPTGSRWVPDKQWDNVDFAGLWLPDKALLDEAKGLKGKKRRAKMEEWAKQACEVYTQWCNGEVYGYDVKIYKVRKDEHGQPYDYPSDYRRDEPPEYEDSCWGMYGWEYVLAEAKASAERGLKEGA